MLTARLLHKCSLYLLLVALLAVSTPAAAAPPSPTTVAISQSLTTQPRTDGRFVVWHDFPAPGSARLMALDLVDGGGQPFLVANLVNQGAEPTGVAWDISDGVVV